MKIPSFFNKIGVHTLGLIAPPSCPICGHGAGRHALALLCPVCKPRLQPQPFCINCGKFLNLPPDLPPPALHICHDCRQARPARWLFRSLGRYQGNMRTAILLLKKNPGGDMFKQLCHKLIKIIRHDVRFCLAWDGVVPIPSRNWSNPHAGYYLARKMAKLLNVKFTPVLHFTRKTAKQTGLKRQARIKNMRHCMAAYGELTGKRFLIVDDVYTTGATACEAARALEKARAEKIGIVTFARSQADR